MSIGLDGNEANTTHRVGSNTYAYQILKGLHAQDSQTKYQIYLKNEPVADLPTSNKNWQYHTFGPGKLWTQWRLPLELYRQISKPDIIFSPGHYAPRFSPVPTVISIMDLAFLYYPEGFQPKVLNQLTNWTRYSVQNAAHIFAISNHTKNDLIKEYQLSPDKITVTPLGSNLKPSKDINAHQLQTLKKKYQITKPYFIFVGTQQPRKNLDRLAKAFIELNQQYSDTQLVIVGKTWHQFRTVNQTNHPDIIYTGYTPENELQSLLKSSLGLVFPSLYEGFGLPVLEAMQSGILVTASNSSSIPEITGSSPLLFNPLNKNEITQRLKTILTMDPHKKQTLIKQGKIRAKQFTWENCTNLTINTLHQLTSNSNH